MAKDVMRHLISIDDLSTSEIIGLLDRAEWHRVHATRTTLFQGRTAGLLFLQPSTRTRVGFHVAMSRLGGQAVEITKTKYQVGMDRAESLSDTICSISSYFDIIVARNSSSEELERVVTLSSVPIINGGSGNNHHPTQSLIDLFAIRRRTGKLEGLRIGLAGDLSRSRAANSLLRVLQRFPPEEIRIMSPPDGNPSRGLIKAFASDIINYCDRIKTDGLDVLYMAGFPLGGRMLSLSSASRANFRLTQQRAEQLPDHGVVLCPLPRIDEIDVNVDVSTKAGYFIQSSEGLYMRMALLEKYLENYKQESQ